MSKTIDNRVQVMFPQEMIDLQREIKMHPELVELLQNHPVDELEIRIAQICAYVAVALDGHYLESDLANICKICHKRLVEKRTNLIIVEGKIQ